MVNSNRRIVSNTILLYLRLIVILVISLYTVRIVLQALGIESYGVYNVVCGFVSMFGFLNSTLASGIQRFFNFNKGDNPNHFNDVFSAAVLIQILLSIIILLFAETVGVWYLNKEMSIPPTLLGTANWIFQFSLIGMIVSIIQVPFMSLVMSQEKFGIYALISIIDTLIKCLIAFFLFFISDDVNRLWWYGLLVSAINIISFFIYYIYYKIRFSYVKFRYRRYNELIKNIIGFSGWNTFGSFVYMMKNQGVNIVLNYFLGSIINAANGIAIQVSGALQSFTNNLVLAFKPQMVQSYAMANFKRVDELFYSMTSFSYALIITISIPIMVNIDFVLDLWLGSNVPEYANTFTNLVMLTIILGAFHTPLTQLMYAMGNVRVFQIVVSLLMGLTVPLAWLSLYIGFSPNSVWWVAVILQILTQICSIMVVRRYYKLDMRRYLSEISKCLLFTIVLFVPIIIIRYYVDMNFAKFIFTCTIDVFVSLIAAFYILLTNYQKTRIIEKLKIHISQSNIKK